MELDVRQNSMMVVRGPHDEKATEKEDRGVSLKSSTPEPKHVSENVSEHTANFSENVSEHTANVSEHTANVSDNVSEHTVSKHTANVSEFWQRTVPVYLGLGEYNEERCAKTNEETTTSNNWLSRLYWCVPVMFPPLLLILACPFLYWFSSSAVRKDLVNLVLNYAGFFIANWVILYVLNPESTPRRVFGKNLKFDKEGVGTINYEPTLMLLIVATCGVIFRVIATGGLSYDNASATIKPSDIYMNLNRSISDVFMRFIGQSFLMWYYCAALVETTEGILLRFCSVPRVQFVCIVLLALPCLQGVLRAALGKDFLTNMGSWNMLLQSRKYKIGSQGQVMESSPVENYMRAAMGFVVNQVFPGIILFTIHAMIFHLKYLDLTKTLFSVAFITKLDDEADDVAQIHLFDENDKEVEAS